MPFPGVDTELRETPPPRIAPTDTSVAFMIDFAERGPTDEFQLFTSPKAFRDSAGGRVGWSNAADAAEVMFANGVSKLYFGRMVGPTPVKASVILEDGSSNDVLKVSAKDPGAWANTLNVEVEAGSAGGTFVLVISDDVDGELERSEDLVDRAAAVTWSEFSDYVDVTLEAGTADPAVVAAQSLTGGTDDHANATITEFGEALELFPRTLGPGQVLAPGFTTDAQHEALLDHGGENNRRALLDHSNTANLTTLKAEDAALRDLDTAKFGAIFGPWVQIRGVTAGTRRTVPYSAVQAGLIALSDSQGDPNDVAAGENGQPVGILDLAVNFTDAQIEELNAAGSTIAKKVYGGVRTYGLRSLVRPADDPNWWQFANSRLVMAITARAEEVGESHVFGKITNRKLARFQGDLIGRCCTPFYKSGSLDGSDPAGLDDLDLPERAFNVNVGPDVNTPTTRAAGELRAAISARPSASAEHITIQIIKRTVDQPVT